MVDMFPGLDKEHSMEHMLAVNTLLYYMYSQRTGLVHKLRNAEIRVFGPTPLPYVTQCNALNTPPPL